MDWVFSGSGREGEGTYGFGGREDIGALFDFCFSFAVGEGSS